MLAAGLLGAAGLARHVEQVKVSIMVDTDGVGYVPVPTLCAVLGGSWQMDPVDRRLEVWLGRQRCRTLIGVPVLECNGRALPTVASAQWIDGEPALPLTQLTQAVGVPGRISGPSLSVTTLSPPRISVAQARRPALERMSAAQVARHLQPLRFPIDGVGPPQRSRWLPGAARAYRSGVHEGFDFFTFATGTSIPYGTPVRSMRSGVVVRAAHDYRELTLTERRQLLDRAARHAHTPDWILDRLHGRSVVVRSEGEVTVRYSHLSGIVPSVTVGTTLATGDVVGWVGNSGTRAGIVGSRGGAHLHCDIEVAGWPFWKYLGHGDAREVLERVFVSGDS